MLFRDEIGTLGLDEQAMLLHALEDKSFLPLGGDKKVKSDFQFIARTNCDLQQMVEQRHFRDDLLGASISGPFTFEGCASAPRP